MQVGLQINDSFGCLGKCLKTGLTANGYNFGHGVAKEASTRFPRLSFGYRLLMPQFISDLTG